MTPNDLAQELGIDPRKLRGWLRSTWPPLHPHSRWDLTAEQVSAARQRFGQPDTSSAPPSSPVTVAVLREADPSEVLPLIPTTTEDNLLADESWSPWVTLTTAVSSAPLQPGVYMARQGGAGGDIVYVGMAGERRGHGIRGRLAIYGSGKGLASGLGEAVFDRALADADWLAARLTEATAGNPRRAKEWGRAAFEWAQLDLRWRVAEDRAAALVLELSVLRSLPNEPLWNRLK